jgi:cyclopropane-fatty-acyl-phospholipid synthase
MRNHVNQPNAQSRPAVPASAVANIAAPLLRRLGFDRGNGLPFAIRFWDGSEIPGTGSTTLVIRSRRALERVLRQPNELGVGRAWVAGDLDIDGGVANWLVAAEHLRELRLRLRDRLLLAAAAVRLGAVHLRRPPIPASEARLAGHRRSLRRDRDAISYHYDLPDAYVDLVLGPSRGYTCGYFEDRGDSLEDAQIRKFDRVCSKLDLQPGERLLDIGCGWGTLMIHAARDYGARVVGVTISESQAKAVRQRIRDAGVADQCEVRLCDWREIDDGPYDKLASVEMIEAVGAANLPPFFATARALVSPGGGVFTQAIVRDAPTNFKGCSSPFLSSYIFPDGELVSVTELLDTMTSSGLEIRGLESLRPHYPMTLRAWSANLDDRRQEAIDLVGIERVRAWDIYLAACALAFERGTLSVHQIVAATPPARTPRLLDPTTRGGYQHQDQDREQPSRVRR